MGLLKLKDLYASQMVYVFVYKSQGAT